MKFRNILAIILAIFTLSSSISVYADIGGSDIDEENILLQNLKPITELWIQKQVK